LKNTSKNTSEVITKFSLTIDFIGVASENNAIAIAFRKNKKDIKRAIDVI